MKLPSDKEWESDYCPEDSPAVSPFDYPEDEIVKSLIGSKPTVRITQSLFRKKHAEDNNA